MFVKAEKICTQNDNNSIACTQFNPNLHRVHMIHISLLWFKKSELQQQHLGSITSTPTPLRTNYLKVDFLCRQHDKKIYIFTVQQKWTDVYTLFFFFYWLVFFSFVSMKSEALITHHENRSLCYFSPSPAINFFYLEEKEENNQVKVALAPLFTQCKKICWWALIIIIFWSGERWGLQKFIFFAFTLTLLMGFILRLNVFCHRVSVTELYHHEFISCNVCV